jgi:sugar phosphate isomerase/epimerase
MKIGICASLSTAGLKAAGFDYLEENVQEFLLPGEGKRAFLDKCRGIDEAPPLYAANCFLPGALKCVGPQVELSKILAYAASAFERARLVKIQRIVFGSGGSRAIPEGFERARALEQFVELLRKLGPLAKEQGITLTVEPLNKGECNFINSLAEGAEAVKLAAHPNVALLCDLYHMAREGEGPEAILACGPLLKHAHIAERDVRSAPGVKGDDFRPYFKALKSVNYQGAMSMECGWGKPGEEAPAALKAMKAQLAEVGL